MACHFSRGFLLFGLVAQVPVPSRRFLTRSIFGSGKPNLAKLSRAVPAWTTSTLMKVCFFLWEGGFQGGRFADLSLNVWHAVIKVVGNGVCCTGWLTWMDGASSRRQMFWQRAALLLRMRMLGRAGGSPDCIHNDARWTHSVSYLQAGGRYNQEIHDLCVLGIPIIILYKASQLIN